MADTMQFDLVSPERSLASVPVREVRLPGSDGDLTAMPGHAPTIVTLRPGMVILVGADGTTSEFAVTGGFAEINQDSVSLLAERGHPREEITQDVYNDMMKDAHRAHRSAKDRREHVGEEVVTAAVKLLGDMQALGTHIGLDPNQSTVPD
ncbi:MULTISPECIES: F0F1 ATP synthase subunit epsilon [Paracoccus]|jgi:F-type H+-transporting ATPase subunit epsilon|uniref:ATP synthase epsilon chain n=2 Tax=Paracoccus TaxID=265 RepID=A0A5C4R4W8_9RHOB|nr:MULTISPECIES: F0F1 ATP synthase subunit epsilon [Paracoccus]TYP62769.1 ATP synthase F1 subcomplex epsilon subunit [Stutzerimonas stutzeri]AZY94714.1 F0F1 ATP synthase subunit epsilon [Paracoccus sp. Arc7-R13]KIX17165.1 ATP synthase F0F1 subunit epsilon [Paracoccus sp. 228]KJZ30912.1 ATP synthase F0F1 subunit epsilon [Paracoccus sp. S4493]MCO6363225.1 F0F1 ATP synthase subunit epsilon [Paracoccus sp. 08]|tara:strand:+ start:8913 stop:9362 length:450 start_codon:yes stop_codon:yes gene_type:complete